MGVNVSFMSEEKKVSRRKWIKYAGAGVVVAAAAAGAGYYATQPKPAVPTPTPTVTPTPTPTPTPTKTPVKEVLMRTITQTGGYGDPAIPIWNAFNKKYAGYMKVEWLSVPFATKQERLFTSLIARSDEFHLTPYLSPWLGALSVHYEDMSKYIEKFKDYPEWRVNLADFPEGLVKSFGTWKGKLVALPFRCGSHGVLFYRKDLYAKKGLEPPKTIDQYIENARKLNDPPNVYGASVRARAGQDVYEDFKAWLYTYGADILNEDQTGTTPYPSKHSQVAERILKAWIQMDQEKLLPPGWLGQAMADQVANMQQGILANMNEYSPRCLLIEDSKTSKVAGKVGYIRFLKDNPEAIGPQRAIGNSWNLAINKYIKDEETKDTVFKLIVWMTSFEMQFLAATQWANGPARVDVMEHPDYQKGVPVAAAHLDSMKIVKEWVVPQVPEAVKIISDEIHLALARKKTVEKAVEDIWMKVGALFR